MSIASVEQLSGGYIVRAREFISDDDLRDALRSAGATARSDDAIHRARIWVNHALNNLLDAGDDRVERAWLLRIQRHTEALARELGRSQDSAKSRKLREWLNLGIAFDDAKSEKYSRPKLGPFQANNIDEAVAATHDGLNYLRCVLQVEIAEWRPNRGRKVDVRRKRVVDQLAAAFERATGKRATTTRAVYADGDEQYAGASVVFIQGILNRFCEWLDDDVDDLSPKDKNRVIPNERVPTVKDKRHREAYQIAQELTMGAAVFARVARRGGKKRRVKAAKRSSEMQP